MKRCAEALSTCGGFHLRRASRVVTQLFDKALDPTGIRSTQLVVLWTVAVDDAPSIAQLARELVLDPSTLTRNLQPLVKMGLVEVTYSGRGKAKIVRLTPAGHQKLQEVLPIWKKTQSEFIKKVGSRRWSEVREELGTLVTAVQNGNGRH